MSKNPTKAWDIKKYFEVIYSPTIIVSLVVLAVDLLSISAVFNFLIGGVFSLLLWLVKFIASAYLGIKVSRASGRIINALAAAVLFGICVGLVDVVGQLIYVWARPSGGIFHLTAISLIFLPINLAIFAAIVAMIAYIISQKD